MAKIFSGKIVIYIDQDDLGSEAQKTLTYKINEKKVGFSDLLFRNFGFLSQKENICIKTRDLISKFKSIHEKDISPYETKLKEILNDINAKDIIIEASGLGGFITLKALEKIKLKSINDINVRLNDVPLFLLPKKWFSAKSNWKKIKIQHNISQGSWLAEKTELYDSSKDHPFKIEQQKVVSPKKAV